MTTKHNWSTERCKDSGFISNRLLDWMESREGYDTEYYHLHIEQLIIKERAKALPKEWHDWQYDIDTDTFSELPLLTPSVSYHSK